MQQKTYEKEVEAPFKTITMPRKVTSVGQSGCARVIAGFKDVAASGGAASTAGSRARVRPMCTAGARVIATVSTLSTRARVEVTATARATVAANAGTVASRMVSSVTKQTCVKTGRRRFTLDTGINPDTHDARKRAKKILRLKLQRPIALCCVSRSSSLIEGFETW